MCGIAGILFADSNRTPDVAILKGMGDAIAHRGPDAEGIWQASGIGLVHRRLSIIDLSGGDQPIGNEDGSVQVVFNGEIYNYRELRGRLESAGHRFRTQSDTEVLVHLYEDVGERLVESLRGMFAFALWDERRRRLLLARDRLGIKPLYVYRDSERLLFGSELKAILAVPGVDRAVDPASLENYLAFGMVPGARSIFRSIEKLPPAHTLVVEPDRLNVAPRRYWSLRIEPDERPTADEWQEAIRAKLDETVRAHLIADVPVGAFLSGGMDSSVIVSLASQQKKGTGPICAQHPSGRSGKLDLSPFSASAIRTFSIGFEEESFSELPFARQVARQFGTDHHEEIVTPDAVSLIDELTHHYDEPFADASAIPTFLVSRLAARHVKVALSGDGGDEAFGGYARYAHDLKEAVLRRWMPGWFRRAVLGPLAAVWPKADWLPRPMRAKTLLTNLSLEPAAAYANTLAQCRPPLRRRLLAPHLAEQLNGHEPERIIRDGHAGAQPDDPLGGMIAADVHTILPDDFLVKVDRASMAHGLEVRPPFLDHELLELAARIPSRFKVHRGETKWILKEAYRDKLPGDIVGRKKHGFEIPVDAWLRGPLREMFESSVLTPQSRVAELIDQAQAERLYRSHLTGRGRHGAVLWSLLMLARWAARYGFAAAQLDVLGAPE